MKDLLPPLDQLVNGGFCRSGGKLQLLRNAMFFDRNRRAEVGGFQRGTVTIVS